MDDIRGRLVLQPGKIIGKRYRVIQQLSFGAYANVYKCMDIKNNSIVAIKCFKSMRDFTKCAYSEAAVLTALNKVDSENKHFIKYYGQFNYHDHVCIIIQEFGMSLFTAFQAHKYDPYPLSIVRQIIYKITLGLQIIHKTGFVHTDIKLENVLLPPNFDLDILNEDISVNHQSDPSSDDFMSKKDSTVNTSLEVNGPLNSSKRLISENSDSKSSTNLIDTRLIDFGSFQSSTTWHANIATSRRYRAPEILLGLRWGKECDIWSLGCILMELATGDIDFDHKDQMCQLFLIQHTIEPFPEWMCKQCTNKEIRERFCWSSPLNLMRPDENWKKELEKQPIYEYLKFDPDLADLTLKMLRTDPFERISIEDILNHPFFAECK